MFISAYSLRAGLDELKYFLLVRSVTSGYPLCDGCIEVARAFWAAPTLLSLSSGSYRDVGFHDSVS